MSMVSPSSCIWRKSSHSDSSGGSCVEVGFLAAVQWKKSTYSDSSGAECVEVAFVNSVRSEWRKSSHSDNTGGQCVEVADLTSAVAVRDSKDPDGPKLVFGASAWATFATRAKAGHLDLS
ncbi:DUF397 domain-containing protein [Actinomadura opuntiae]|uniref:DUF397 domain-containing protein n=1 Tax=Actinomadura sp. OS1-43 TaxID=604315 RepID=UPI00255AD42D|nr:DUF397 domain-containing protein [Actinomadura sp. OS1-43]MDL4816271.1 DUF397 domain-containing protein [Actinomadura sp. OS1-43]